jgi:hypothetical protein
MAVRPAPTWEAPPGYVHEPMLDPSWRVVTGERQCRQARNACGAPAVAEFNRGRRGRTDDWWAYCPDHMYGRWIEDGRVCCWRVVPIKERQGDSHAR